VKKAPCRFGFGRHLKLGERGRGAAVETVMERGGEGVQWINVSDDSDVRVEIRD
jgi:hypothetical protein